MITPRRHDLLRAVPPAAVRVLEMGSTAPGALLYDARRLFDAQDARATGGPACLTRKRHLIPEAPVSRRSVHSPPLPHTQHLHTRPSCTTQPQAAGELLELARGSELGPAADDCLAAAAAELDPLKQAALLKAACYGRAFRVLEPGADSWADSRAAGRSSGGGGGGGGGGEGELGLPPVDPRRRTVEVARRLRLLNALREPGGWLA